MVDSNFPASLLNKITDIQYTKPNVQLRLTRVGVKNMKLHLRIVGRNGSFLLTPTIDLYVDLPSDKRGVHLSRHPESIYEVLHGEDSFKAKSVEDFCETIAGKLLEKHEYAHRTEVHLESSYIVTRRSSKNNNSTQEPCKIYARATAVRKSERTFVNKMVGVSIVGFTTCPCTKELVKAFTREKLAQMGFKKGEVERIIKNVPLATHTQRTTASVLIQVPEKFFVDVEDLARILEDSMSGQTYTLLKRPEEASVILEALNRARFVEDVVREILGAAARKYANFPEETLVFARALSQESVHKHDIIAERTATLGEIKREMTLSQL